MKPFILFIPAIGAGENKYFARHALFYKEEISVNTSNLTATFIMFIRLESLWRERAKDYFASVNR